MYCEGTKLWKIINCYSFLLVSSCKGLETNDSLQVFYPPPYDILFGSKKCFHISQYKAENAFYPQTSKLHLKKGRRKIVINPLEKAWAVYHHPSGNRELADLIPKGDTGLETERRCTEDKIREKPDNMEHFQRQWRTVSETAAGQQQSDAGVLSLGPPEWGKKGKYWTLLTLYWWLATGL